MRPLATVLITTAAVGAIIYPVEHAQHTAVPATHIIAAEAPPPASQPNPTIYLSQLAAAAVATPTTTTTAKPIVHHTPTKPRPITVHAASAPTTVPAPTGPVDCLANHGPKWRMPSQAMAHQCWDNLINQYRWNHTVAFDKMWCESGGNPWAANASGAHGLMQILSTDEHGNYIGSFNPATNMQQAWEKYSASGWRPWVC